MGTMPAVENAAIWFNAKTVTHHLDVVVVVVVVVVVDTRTVEPSTVRFYNADGFEFMTVKSDSARHAEDGRLYAILKDDDSVREEPVDLFPFVDVQVGPSCEFGRRITAVAVEYGPADVTVSLIAPFAELVTATRPYSEDEVDYLL